MDDVPDILTCEGKSDLDRIYKSRPKRSRTVSKYSLVNHEKLYTNDVPNRIEYFHSDKTKNKLTLKTPSIELDSCALKQTYSIDIFRFCNFALFHKLDEMKYCHQCVMFNEEGGLCSKNVMLDQLPMRSDLSSALVNSRLRLRKIRSIFTHTIGIYRESPDMIFVEKCSDKTPIVLWDKHIETAQIYNETVTSSPKEHKFCTGCKRGCVQSENMHGDVSSLILIRENFYKRPVDISRRFVNEKLEHFANVADNKNKTVSQFRIGSNIKYLIDGENGERKNKLTYKLNVFFFLNHILVQYLYWLVRTCKLWKSSKKFVIVLVRVWEIISAINIKEYKGKGNDINTLIGSVYLICHIVIHYFLFAVLNTLVNCCEFLEAKFKGKCVECTFISLYDRNVLKLGHTIRNAEYIIFRPGEKKNMINEPCASGDYRHINLTSYEIRGILHGENSLKIFTIPDPYAESLVKCKSKEYDRRIDIIDENNNSFFLDIPHCKNKTGNLYEDVFRDLLSFPEKNNQAPEKFNKFKTWPGVKSNNNSCSPERGSVPYSTTDPCSEKCIPVLPRDSIECCESRSSRGSKKKRKKSKRRKSKKPKKEKRRKEKKKSKKRKRKHKDDDYIDYREGSTCVICKKVYCDCTCSTETTRRKKYRDRDRERDRERGRERGRSRRRRNSCDSFCDPPRRDRRTKRCRSGSSVNDGCCDVNTSSYRRSRSRNRRCDTSCSTSRSSGSSVCCSVPSSCSTINKTPSFLECVCTSSSKGGCNRLKCRMRPAAPQTCSFTSRLFSKLKATLNSCGIPCGGFPPRPGSECVACINGRFRVTADYRTGKIDIDVDKKSRRELMCILNRFACEYKVGRGSRRKSRGRQNRRKCG